MTIYHDATVLILRTPTVGRAAYTVAHLVTLECTRKVINLFYHCRHCARDIQNERYRGHYFLIHARIVCRCCASFSAFLKIYISQGSVATRCGGCVG